MRRINLAGDHYTMGQQHGNQVRDLRPKLMSVIKRRLAILEQCEIDLSPFIADLRDVWEQHAQGTMDMLQGIADVLQLEWDGFFRYSIASYLEDRTRCGRSREGCTTWAAGPPVTAGDSLLLVKNRDYRPDHLDLQCMAFANPAQGYAYAFVTSAGSPGIFSSGMNETGLTVADTHVSSLDMGPGLARYSLMLDILEQHDRVSSVLDYLQSVPHTGNGTIIVLDRAGDMAVFEIAHGAQALIQPENGYIVSTNHYTSLHLRDRWEDRRPHSLGGNSLRRYVSVSNRLRREAGHVDVAWTQSLMSEHQGPLDSICRHPDVDRDTVTISSVIYLPLEGRFYLASGHPCREGSYIQYSL